MLIISVFIVAVVVMRLSGRDFSRLNDLKIRWRSLALAAVTAQVAIIVLWPNGWRPVHLIVHLGSYVAVGVFLWANRHISRLWVVAAGTASNAAAIVANGGVMPASATAMSVSRLTNRSGFANSATVGHARLQILGDVIPTPSWLPLHNVASIGDVLIVIGALLVIAHYSKDVKPLRSDRRDQPKQRRLQSPFELV